MASHTPVTILLIDDEPSFVCALARLLRRDGYTVDTVDNGQRALAQLHTQRYDLILCDLHMPVLDGPAIEDQIELGPRCDSTFALASRLDATVAPLPALLRQQLSMGMCSRTGPTVSAICSSSIWSRRSKAPLRLLRA